MCPAFPSSDYYGSSVPPQRLPVQAALSFNRPAATDQWRCPLTARLRKRLVALDVLHPQPIRTIGTELAMHQIVRAHIGRPGSSASFGSPSTGDASEAAFTHQAFDTFCG